MHQALHSLFPRKCVRKAVWDQGVLRCPCGNIVAIRYRVGQRTATFVTPRFARWRDEIDAGSALCSPEEVTGSVTFDDFAEAISAMPPMHCGTDWPLGDDEETDEERTVEEDT